MSDERRKALGIPIHKAPEDHVFVDDYCSCGEQDPASKSKGLRTQSHTSQSTGSIWRSWDRRLGSHVNLDTIEGNSEEYFG